MKSSLKTKKIQKKHQKVKQINEKPNEEDELNDFTKGDPLIKNLSDFVTAITPTYVSKPIYTGGRILSGQHRIYSSCNEEIVIYDVKQQTIVQKIKHVLMQISKKNQEIFNFGLDPQEKNIITYSSNNLLRVINIQTQKILHKVKLNPKHFAYDIQYSIDARFLAIGFSNGIIKIYTAETMKQTHSYKSHNFSLRKLEWHYDPQTLQLISVDEQKTLLIFDYILNKVIGQVKSAGKNFVQTTKGTSLIVSCDQQIKVYDYKTLHLLFSFAVPDYVDAMHYLENGTLVFGGEQTRVYNVDLNDKKQEVKSDIKTSDLGVLKILSLPYHKSILIVSAEQNLALVDGKTFSTKETIIGFNDQIIDIKYSKSSRKQKNASDFVIVITNSSNAKIFNRHNMKLISFLTGHEDTILCIQYFHPYVLTAGKDKVVKLHEIDVLGKSRLIANYYGHSEYISGLSAMIDKKMIVSTSQDKTLKLWPLVQEKQNLVNIKTALSTVSAHSKSINTVRTSPNQDFIATCSHDRTIRIWGPDLKLYFTLSGHRRGVWDAAFHPVEKLVVSVAGDGALKGWSLFNGECLWSLGEGQALMRCQWIYHHQVITSSIDGIVKIWDIRKQTSLSYDKHEGKIWALQVMKDEQSDNKIQVMTGGNDSTIYLWKDSTAQTKGKILKNLQLEQQEKIQIEQLLHQRKYTEAALLAFQNKYTQMFIHIVNKMFSQFYEDSVNEVKFQDGKLMIAEDEQHQQMQQFSQTKLESFVKTLFDANPNKFFNLLYIMTLTVKNYKSASNLFLSLIKSIPLTKIIEMQKTFSLERDKRNDLQELSSKKSDLEEFLEKMQIYTEKHLNRIERYIRGTYFLEHLKNKEENYVR